MSPSSKPFRRYIASTYTKTCLLDHIGPLARPSETQIANRPNYLWGAHEHNFKISPGSMEAATCAQHGAAGGCFIFIFLYLNVVVPDLPGEVVERLRFRRRLVPSRHFV